MPGFEKFGDEERQSVNDVLETGILMRYGFNEPRNNIWKAKEFENDFAAKMKSGYCQLVSSGTAAISVALACGGVGAGDEVILPTFTFVASFEAVLAIGAVPVLADIDETLTLNPAAVSKLVTPKTKAVMPVHMCGSMANLKELKAICDTHNLLLVEDACQALGGSYEGKPLGSYGDMGCFSFDFVKTITCGEGGAVLTNNKDFAVKADQYQDHGHDHVGNDRGAETHPYMGYNYRISELHAAVGVAQLKKLESFIAIQKEHYNVIKSELNKLPEVTFRKVPEGGVENYSFLSFFLPTEAAARNVAAQLKDNGVDGCFYWFDNNWHYVRQWHHLKEQKSLGSLSHQVLQQMPDYTTADFSASDAVLGRNISVLIKLSWSKEEVLQRAKNIRSVIAHYFSA